MSLSSRHYNFVNVFVYVCDFVCLCVCVRNVDGTPATSKRQPDVKAEGLVARGHAEGGPLAVHWQCSHMIIIRA